jgi:hypothetical protein
MFRLAKQFCHHIVPKVVRPLQVVWNQVIGFLFLVLAAWSVPHGVRTIREFDGQPGSLVHLALSALFTSAMTVYGVLSFLRARKISRS